MLRLKRKSEKWKREPNPRRPEGRVVGFVPSDTHPGGSRSQRRARVAPHTHRFVDAAGRVVLLHSTKSDGMVAKQLAREARARRKAARKARRRYRQTGRWS